MRAAGGEESRLNVWLHSCFRARVSYDLLLYVVSLMSVLNSALSRFLLVSESPLQLSEHLSRHEHGMSIIRCLLAASNVLRHSYPDDVRVERVVRGVYAFVLYAADFWLDSLLYEFDASDPAENATIGEFLMLSSKLATALGCSSSVMLETVRSLQSSLFMSLLDTVQRYGPALTSMTRAAIESQSKTSLDPASPEGYLPHDPAEGATYLF